MSMKDWERGVLEEPGAAERVTNLEDDLRLAAGLTALRERAGLSQRDVAQRLGVSQPRVVAIEQSKNVTIEVLQQYVGAVGGHLELSTGGKRINLLSHRVSATSAGRIAAKATAKVAAKPPRKEVAVKAERKVVAKAATKSVKQASRPRAKA